MRKEQKGLALLQVMIAAGITSVLALALAQLTSNQSKSVMYLEDQLEKISLIRNIETLLKDNISCQSSFEKIKLDKLSVELSDIKDPGGNVIFSSNTAESNLNIGQLRLESGKLIGPSSSGLVELIVPISRIRGSDGSQHFKSYRAKIIVSTNADEEIVGCFSASNAAGAVFKTSCAPGYTFMGTPGEQDSYCISTNKEPKMELADAASNCYNKSPRARLCSASEWLTACVSGIVPNMTGTYERIGGYGRRDGSKLLGLIKCTSSEDGHATHAYHHRCCYK